MLYIVGLGPGSQQLMTQEAIETIKKVDTIVGYITYIHLVEDMIKGKDIVTTGMRGEIERSKKKQLKLQKLVRMLPLFLVGMPVFMVWLV